MVISDCAWRLLSWLWVGLGVALGLWFDFVGRTRVGLAFGHTLLSVKCSYTLVVFLYISRKGNISPMLHFQFISCES